MPIPEDYAQEDQDILESRRKLIEETRKFRALPDSEKTGAIPAVFKLYHAEIDSLAVKCRQRSSALSNCTQELVSRQRLVDQYKEEVERCKAEAEQTVEEATGMQETMRIGNARLEHQISILSAQLDERTRQWEELMDSADMQNCPASQGIDMEQMRIEYNKALDQITKLTVL